MSSKKQKRVDQKENKAAAAAKPKEPETIDVDFEAFPLDDGDYKGISSLLQQMLGARAGAVNVGGIADILIEQSPLGCIIKQCTEEEDEMEAEDDGEIFAVTSLFDLNQEKKSVTELRAFLTKKLKTKGAKGQGVQRIRTLLDGSKAEDEERIGFIVSERFINLPHTIALPSLQALMSDMTESAGFQFNRYMMIMKIHVPGGGGGTAAGKAEKKAAKAAGLLNEIYANAEEELLAEDCDAWFEYPVETEQGDMMSFDEAFSSKRRVVLFSHEDLVKYMKKLEKELG